MKKRPPKDSEERPRLKLKESTDPRRRPREEPTSPILDRLPEPKAPRVPLRLQRALRVSAVFIVLAALVAGALLLFPVSAPDDSDVWPRAVTTLQTLETKPANADALNALEAIIAEIPDQEDNRRAMAGLKTVLALGWLGRGRYPEGLKACAYILEHYPQSGFDEFVTYTNLVNESSGTVSTPSPAVKLEPLTAPPNGQIKRIHGTLPLRPTAPAAPAKTAPLTSLSRTRIKHQYDAALRKALLLCQLKEAESQGRDALRRFQESVR